MNEKTFNEDCVRKANGRINSAKGKVSQVGAGRGRHAPDMLLIACTVRAAGGGRQGRCLLAHQSPPPYFPPPGSAFTAALASNNRFTVLHLLLLALEAQLPVLH